MGADEIHRTQRGTVSAQTVRAQRQEECQGLPSSANSNFTLKCSDLLASGLKDGFC